MRQHLLLPYQSLSSFQISSRAESTVMKKDEAARAMATTGILIKGLDAPPIEMKRTQPPGNTRDPDGKRVSRIPLAEEGGDETEGDETEGDETEGGEGGEGEEKQGKRAASSSSGWRTKQSPSPFTDEMREIVGDKLLGIYNDLISDEDMDLYDMWTIPGLGKREIVAWSQCIDEGYEGTLEAWGEEVATKVSELKWVLMHTPLLATMAQDFPMGQDHRIIVSNIITKISRIIQGNMGTYPNRGKKLWRPQSLIDGEEQLKRFSIFLFINKKLPKDRDLIDLLELQMEELQRWLTNKWTSDFKDPMPADVAAEDLTKGLASKLVADFIAARASRKVDYMKANMDASTAIKSLQWRIDREKGFLQRKEAASKAQEETQKRRADEKQQRLERDRKAADADEEAARAELRRKEARAEARQKNRLAARRREEIDPTVADASSDSSELSDPMEMHDPMPAMVPTPAPAAAPSVDIDHGALLLDGVSGETTQQLVTESDVLQAPMPATDHYTQTALAQALRAVQTIANNTYAYYYNECMLLMKGYRKAVEKSLKKYAAFFMKAMQQLQYANVETFDYFSANQGALSLNQGYTDDASLRPGPPQPGTDDEIQSELVGTIIPSEASEVAEEYDEKDFESDEEEEGDRPLTQTQLQPESQLPESQLPDSDEDDDEDPRKVARRERRLARVKASCEGCNHNPPFGHPSQRYHCGSGGCMDPDKPADDSDVSSNMSNDDDDDDPFPSPPRPAPAAPAGVADEGFRGG